MCNLSASYGEQVVPFHVNQPNKRAGTTHRQPHQASVEERQQDNDSPCSIISCQQTTQPAMPPPRFPARKKSETLKALAFPSTSPQACTRGTDAIDTWASEHSFLLRATRHRRKERRSVVPRNNSSFATSENASTCTMYEPTNDGDDDWSPRTRPEQRQRVAEHIATSP